MTQANKYHRKALHCARTAEHMRDPGERAKLLEIARAYLGLARHVAERQDHGIAHRPSEHDPRPLKDAEAGNADYSARANLPNSLRAAAT